MTRCSTACRLRPRVREHERLAALAQELLEGQRHLRQLARRPGASRTSRARSGCRHRQELRAARPPARARRCAATGRRCRSPRAHMCLIASLLDISEPMRSGTPGVLEQALDRRARARAALAHQQVGLGQRRQGRAWRSRISGCVGAAMKAIGCLANGRRLGLQLARRPAHDGQVDLLAGQHAHDLVAVADLQLDLHLRVLVAKVTSIGGSRYSAVVTAPTRRVPVNTPCSVAISSPASRHRSRMRPA